MFSQNIRPGDIILTKNPKSFQSKGIRFGTFGPFSHAALYLGRYCVIEAIGHGVTNYSALRRGVHCKKNVKVLRLKKPYITQFLKTFDGRLGNYIGQGFWVIGAMKSSINSNKSEVNGRRFCSQLVAEIFLKSGINLCPGFRPENIHPNMILDSSLLTEVTKEVLISVGKNSVDHLEPMDVRQKVVAQHLLVKIERKIVDDLSVYFNSINLRRPKNIVDISEILINEMTLDNWVTVDLKLCSILQTHGFVDFNLEVFNTYIKPAFTGDKNTENLSLKEIRTTLFNLLNINIDLHTRKLFHLKCLAIYKQVLHELPISTSCNWLHLFIEKELNSVTCSTLGLELIRKDIDILIDAYEGRRESDIDICFINPLIV
jgi:hypothetical protein